MDADAINELLEQRRITLYLLSRHADKLSLAQQLFERLVAVEAAIAEVMRRS
jgi:hypothetical protein